MKKLVLALVAASCTLPLSATSSGAPPPVEVARGLLEQASAAISRCLAGMPLRATIRLRLNAKGWTEVVEVSGTTDERARTCVRVVVEDLRFPAGVRAALKEVTLPIEVGPAPRPCMTWRRVSATRTKLVACNRAR
jgi:hypothetical protein